jgi:hypothetical protein
MFRLRRRGVKRPRGALVARSEAPSDRNAGDDEADDDVRPRRAAEPDSERREQDGHVRDDVVPRARAAARADVPNLAAIVHRRRLGEVCGDLKMAGHPARMRSLVGRLRCTVERSKSS